MYTFADHISSKKEVYSAEDLPIVTRTSFLGGGGPSKSSLFFLLFTCIIIIIIIIIIILLLFYFFFVISVLFIHPFTRTL